MRQIEQNMIRAIRTREPFNRSNTRVRISPTGIRADVYLHGNLIAITDSERVHVTLAGYPTRTTRSRVNALLEGLGFDAHVYQRDYEQHARIHGTVYHLEPDDSVEIQRDGQVAVHKPL